MRTIGIWCEHNFQLYSALPIIKKYITKNKVIVFTKKENLEVFERLISHEDLKFENINQYFFKPASLLKHFFEILFVSENFSYAFKNMVVRNKSTKNKLLGKTFFLKIPSNKINKIYSNFNSFFFKNKSIDNYYDLDLLITLSKVHYSYLIPSREIVPHINIMESWDHPMKFPYYILPNYCLTWNKDLSNDIKRIQGLEKVRQIKPLKFGYIYDYKNISRINLLKKLDKTKYFKELTKLSKKRIILYPTTTSSSGYGHKGEMKLINDLCATFEHSDYYLYIKPKPNAPKGDYEIFKKYKNVIVGVYSNNESGSDMLDENYHIFRYLLLDMAEIVINVGTTFGLEAALMDKPIIQLELKDNEYFGFAEFCKTYHLSKYVLSLQGVIPYEGRGKAKEKLIEEVKNNSIIFSTKLKKWITNW